MSRSTVSYGAEMLTRDQVLAIVQIALADPKVSMAIDPMVYFHNAWTVHLDGLQVVNVAEIDKVVQS